MSSEQSSSSTRKLNFKAFFVILRPQNCVIGGLTVIAGLAIAYRMNPVGSLGDYLLNFIFGYLTYFFVAGGGNIVNDIFDIEVDKINRPHRPLPSGQMTTRQAWYYVVALSIAGIFFAWLNGVYGAIVVVIFLVVGYAYASKVKELGLAGNLLVAFSFAFGVIYGSFVYGELVGLITIPFPTILFFFTAFMILQARETIKGAEDVEGDELRDVRTIARVFGYKAAAGLAALLNLIGVICYILIWCLGYASWALWPLLVTGSAVVLGAAIVPLTGPNNKKALLIGSTLDKIGALVGLIAFVLIPLYGF